MRAIGLGLICAAFWMIEGLPASAQSDSAGELAKPVEQCIRDNAPAVEQAFSSLNDGVSYLVADLCGAPIAADQERQRRERAAAAAAEAHAQCEANRTADQKSEPAQPDPCGKPANNILNAFMNPLLGNLQEAAAAQMRYYNSKPPAATSLAAKLLLELRLKRLNATQQGTH